MEKEKRVKRIINSMTLMLAFVALVVASIGASFSFAWFSEHSTAQIQEVNFNSQAVTNIGFDGPSKDDPQGTYLGQTAFDTTGKLILGNEANISDPTYFANKAYECAVPISVTANNQMVDIKILSVKINAQPPINITNENARFGFTWYMIQQNDAGKVYGPNGTQTQIFKEIVEKPTSFVANKYYKLDASNKYVKIKDQADLDSLFGEGKANKVYVRNGLKHGFKEITVKPSFVANTYYKFDADKYVIVKDQTELGSLFGDGKVNKVYEMEADISTKITLDCDKQLFDFYIVFCPQTLYWNQFKDYVTNEDLIKVSKVYTGNDLKMVYNNTTAVGATSTQLYYSNDSYKGSTFEFNIQMSVGGAA